MRTYYSADYILPICGEPIKNGVVSVDESGEILGVFSEKEPLPADSTVTRFDGIIVPGFINTHCHLELSYLKDQLPRNTGLIPFIKNVISSRNNEQVVFDAIETADQLMYDNGIVAVADISNTLQTKETKLKSKLYYHTFVEMICFEPEKARQVFEKGGEMLQEFSPLRASLAAHSPYSVCKELLRFISKICGETGEAMSIHNQESEEENKLYRYKTGGFIDFYRDLGRNIDFFKPQARNSIQSFIPLLSNKQKILLVHNTYTSTKDIYFIRRSGKNITWCFCPNANLYIEGRLPKIDMFVFEDYNITLGTDSLASNSNLCILSELKTIHQRFPELNFTETIKWATINGARYLGIDATYGSIEKGKKPGLNLITNVNGLSITTDSAVKKTYLSAFALSLKTSTLRDEPSLQPFGNKLSCYSGGYGLVQRMEASFCS